MEAAPSAIPPNPNKAATIAITKKIAAQRNIMYWFNYNGEAENEMPGGMILK